MGSVLKNNIELDKNTPYKIAVKNWETGKYLGVYNLDIYQGKMNTLIVEIDGLKYGKDIIKHPHENINTTMVKKYILIHGKSDEMIGLLLSQESTEVQIWQV